MGGNGGTGVRFCGFNCAWFQPLIVLLLILYNYIVYVGLNLLPTLQNINTSNLLNDEGFITGVPGFQSFINDPHATRMSFTAFIIVTLGFHVILLLFFASFIKAIVTPPGSVPVEKQADRKKWDDGLFDISPEDDQRIEDITMDHSTDLNNPDIQSFIKGMILVERKKESHQQAHGLKRHCKNCQIYKPDRTHHCKVCGHCVLRMDHHCPWLANCVGFRNYKYFLLSLFYAILLCAWILASMGQRFTQVFQPILNRHNFWYMDLPVAISYGITLIAFIGLTIFFSFHVYMSLHAMTSIERTEKRTSLNSEVQHRFRIAHIKYDYGWKENWQHIMGPPSVDNRTNYPRSRISILISSLLSGLLLLRVSHMWLFPVDANPLDDGTYSQPFMRDLTKER